MAELAVQTMAKDDSITPIYSAAASGGDTVPNNGKTFLHIKNGSGSPIVATIGSFVNCDQGFDHDVDVTIPAGSEEMVGPFTPVSRFDNGSNVMSLTYDDVTTLTIAAISL